jgi:hypothetical protein
MSRMVYGSLAFSAVFVAVGAHAVLSAADPPAPRMFDTRVTPATVTSSGTVEPAAAAALNRMGSYLRTLKSFQVKAVVTREDVMNDGEKVSYTFNTDVLARRPDRLRVRMNSDRADRLYFFDGKHFTLFAPRQGFYTVVPAPGTINALADVLSNKYGIDLPLVDLFRWGDNSGVGLLTSATDIGPSDVNGITCEQYAFRQDDADWQLWLQQGDFPLPCKVVITTMSDEARPQYTATYSWNLTPSFNNDAFVLKPPADAHKIAIAGEDIARAIKKP